MPHKEFLETYPLYRRFTHDFSAYLEGLPQPAIHMHCPVCGSEQTFRLSNKFHEHGDGTASAVVRAVYLCHSCVDFERYFLIHFDPEGKWVEKVGQYPPWDISPDPLIEGALGDQAHLYRKGLVCESQSYGVGAFAYYRRIVEDVIDGLLDDISELMEGEDLARYEEALEKTKATIVASEKIDLVKDLLPPILRPGDVNPLSLLHDILSDGLHGQSDETCMELAAEIRESLTFLVQQVSVSRKSSQTFTDRMKRFLERKSAKGTS